MWAQTNDGWLVLDQWLLRWLSYALLRDWSFGEKSFDINCVKVSVCINGS
jgi:hypothetical protein